MKKKVFDKFHSLKVDGLTKRWLLNIILVVVIVLAVTFTVACVTIKKIIITTPLKNIFKIRRFHKCRKLFFKQSRFGHFA
ncbi:MAG: hypothetical protein L6V88_05415 [Anaerotruncus sp.]|nr:MAG: hypothetical protein L6V88_05415 [Anaerotruncus sp.]